MVVPSGANGYGQGWVVVTGKFSATLQAEATPPRLVSADLEP